MKCNTFLLLFLCFTATAFAEPISLSYKATINNVSDPTGVISVGMDFDFSVEFDVEASASYFENDIEYLLTDDIWGNDPEKVHFFQTSVSGIDIFPDAPFYTTPSWSFNNGTHYSDIDVNTTSIVIWNIGGSKEAGTYWENQLFLSGAGNISNWNENTMLSGTEKMFDQRRGLSQNASFKVNASVPTTPVPEPSTLYLFSVGLGMILYLTYKKNILNT